MIDLRHLKHALALAEYGNFARAADACHITQSALTKSIQALEDHLGVELFDRSVKPVVPTDIGRLVLRHSSVLDSSVREMLRDVKLARSDDVGELSVGVGLFGGSSLVSPVVARMIRQYPQLRLTLKVSAWSDLPIKARARETDIILVEQGTLVGQTDFTFHPLLEHRNFLVCRQGHPLLSRKKRGVADLFEFPVIAPDFPQSAIDRICAGAPDALRSALSSGDSLVLRCDSSAIIKEVLMETDAIASMHSFMIVRELDAGQLVAIPNLDLHITARFCVAWLSGRTLSSASRRFIELLADYDREIYERF